ncbi:hypothetical protein [Powai lake megavirus]|uniref:Glycosyl transferase family 25 domain-containing protein n=1 Tax=Powai lake megavirus TaxID=1842663 RepID=A0A161HLH6_9VIRU|nr:hypothetical protein QJ849_gp670 [Powai lake megavirus]ANB50832.1 hypothetical protein [Powai lake megavirus]
MILDQFPKVLWINLDRSIERKNYMELLLKTHNINHTRITAVDGSNITELTNICVTNPSITNQENACTCSHILAMKYFLDEINDNEIIIFEDDVSFEFLKFIPYNWSKLYSNLPKDYGLIQLAITRDRGPVSHVLTKITLLYKYYCSAAYLITRDTAKEIINKYYCKESGKIDLSQNDCCTADGIITNTNKTYSIPIFSYQTSESTIHPKHLIIHNKSKTQQHKMWSIIARTKNFDVESYFNKFPK